MPFTKIQIFVYSAGTFLLAAACAVFMTNLANPAFGMQHDPILTLPVRTLFWILGSLAAAVALVCLFGKRLSLQLFLLSWLALNLLVYRAGVGSSLTGYLDDVADVFGLSLPVANSLTLVLAWYLLAGGLFSLLWLVKSTKAAEADAKANDYLKTACPHCGGHVKFPSRDGGRRIPCPHCRQELVLPKSALLKMACYFCQGHIEFPAHASGTKMACPHCKQDITLKELA